MKVKVWTVPERNCAAVSGSRRRRLRTHKTSNDFFFSYCFIVKLCRIGNMLEQFAAVRFFSMKGHKHIKVWTAKVPNKKNTTGPTVDCFTFWFLGEVFENTNILCTSATNWNIFSNNCAFICPRDFADENRCDWSNFSLAAEIPLNTFCLVVLFLIMSHAALSSSSNNGN